MNPSPAKRILVLLISGLLPFAGCSKTNHPQVANSQLAESMKPASAAGGAQPSGSGQGSIHQPSGFAHVTYRPNVHIMEEEEGRKAIIGVSTYENALLFDSSNPTARALHAGDVLMIRNLIVRRVLASEETPDGVIVLTEKGALTDLIQDGQIHVEMPVRYGPAQAAAPNHPFWSFDLAQPAYAQSPAGIMASKAVSQGTRDAYNNLFKGLLSDLIDDWDTTFEATPGQGQTNLNLVCKKEISGFKAIITGQGYVSNFGFLTDMNFSNSTLQQMDTDFKNLNGAMTFQWLVGTESGGVRANESRIKLPGAIETPLAPLVGGIPLNLEVSAAILIHPAITGGREYTKGQFKITYDGSQHFKVKTGSLDAAGNVTGTIDLADHQDLSPSAPLGMVIAFAAPRIELSVGLNKIGKLDTRKAVDIVDKLADAVAKRLLNPQQYQSFQQNGLQLGKLLRQTLSTDAAAYFQTVASSSSSFSGNMSITPCSRYDLIFSAQVGASAELVGVSLGNLNKEIYKKQMTRVDPPGTTLCENIGKN